MKRKYLATIHPAKFLIITLIHLTTCMFPCSTEWTWSSVPWSTHPPAARLGLSRSRPTRNNATSTASQLARLTLNSATPKNTHSFITSHNQKSVRLKNVKVFEN